MTTTRRRAGEIEARSSGDRETTTLTVTSGKSVKLTIERLVEELEQAARVDEIKDIRDRAMAIELYCRKKAGGLAAAQAAGKIVAEATLKLAKLYAEEKSAKTGPKKLPDRGPVTDRPGKLAVAEAADLDDAQLRRLAPLVDRPREEIDAAMAAIEARGEIVSPSALLREVVGEVPAGAEYRLVIVINGRRLTPVQLMALRAAVAAQLLADGDDDPALKEIHRMLEDKRRAA